MKILNSVFAKPLFCSIAVLMTISPSQDSAAEEIEADQVFSRYARFGADTWANNPIAKISGEGHACISCHTSMPYALVEPLIPGPYPAYDDMIINIENLVMTWSENTPWYSDGKLERTAVHEGLPPDTLKEVLDAADSRGVEAVFNALILAMRDAYAQSTAQMETERAFENMWSFLAKNVHENEKAPWSSD